VAYAMGKEGTERYLDQNPHLDFYKTFGVSLRQFRRRLFWKWHEAEANQWLDHCEEYIYEELFDHPAYREALVLHLVSHSHKWYLNLLTQNSWVVNLEAIGAADTIDYLDFSEMPSESEVEKYSSMEEFKELKKLIINVLAEYSE
jgi:hypothetical protein